MLTFTYVLVALSVEQASMRMGLQSLQQYVQTHVKNQNNVSLSQLQYACTTLSQLYQACRWSKIDMYLLPALRRTSEQADRLIDELSALNDDALVMVETVQRQSDGMGASNAIQIGALCESVDACCCALLKRLEKQEREVFTMARSAICGKDWFSIANQFLQHDAHLLETRRCRSQPPLGVNK